MNSILTKSQYKSEGPKPISGYAPGAAIWAHLRYDDECGNGHNTFAITATVREPKRRDIAAGGCMHEEIAKAFSHLAPFIKWHLVSSDGPMHYLANTMYHAGNRDHNGKAEGEPDRFERRVYFKGFPLGWDDKPDFVTWLETQASERNEWTTEADFEVIRVDHEREHKKFGPGYTLGGYGEKWYQCPFKTEAEALEFVAAMRQGWKVVKVPKSWSKGKSRDLDAARSCAVWPDATDEELTAPGLEDRLKARLPALLAEFKAAMESLGFTY